MDTTLYKLTKDNLDKCFHFYFQTKDRIDNFYKFLKKYKEYTKTYHSNLQQLFNSYLYPLTNNENSNLNNKKNDNEQIERRNSIFELDSSIIDDQQILSPLRIYFEKIIKFFKEYLFITDVYIKSLDNPVNLLKSNLDDAIKKIKEIQKLREVDENRYINSYNSFESENKNLLQKFENVEKDIVTNCIKIKNSPKQKDELEKLIDSKIKEVLKLQNSFQEKINKNNSNANDLKNNSNKYIANINGCTIKLFDVLNKSFNDFIDFFKKGQSLISTEINSQQGILDNKDNDEKEIKNLINENLKEIPQDECDIKYKKYDIKILSDKEYFNNKVSYENIKRKARHSLKSTFNRKSINNNINSDNNKKIENGNNYELSDEDIYNIIKKMYNSFMLVNRDNYSLDIEYNKIQIIKITDKILSHFNNEKIDEKEINVLNNLMDNKQNAYNFLIHLNNFRKIGIFELPKKNFYIISKVFLNIINNISHEQNENFYYDLDNARLILILSVTFYYLDDNEKIYLRSEFKNDNNVYKSFEFWEKFVHHDIEKDIKRIQQLNSREGNGEVDNKKIQNVIFTNILPTVSNMKDFGMKSEDIYKIVLSISEEYGIEKEMKDNIMNMIKDIKFQE